MSSHRDTQDVVAMARRIDGLERRTRLLMVLLALFLLVFVWRELYRAPAEVRSSRFSLVDASGTERGMWRVQDGVAALILRDDEGIWRAIMAVGGEGTTPSGARIEVNDGRPDGSLVAVTTEHGVPAVRFWENRAGAPQIEIESEMGEPVIVVQSDDGAVARLRPRGRSAEDRR